MDSLIYLLMHIGNESKTPHLSLNNHNEIRFIAIGHWGSGRSRQKEVAEALEIFVNVTDVTSLLLLVTISIVEAWIL